MAFALKPAVLQGRLVSTNFLLTFAHITVPFTGSLSKVRVKHEKLFALDLESDFSLNQLKSCFLM